MKVLTLNYEYPPVGGGGGRLCAAVCEGLAARGHEVMVVTAGLRNLSGSGWVRGVRVIRPQTFRRAPDTCTVPEMAQYLALAAPAALRAAQTWRPDIIHAHFVVPTGALAWAVNRLAGCPYVLTAHLGDVPGGAPEQTRGLFRWALAPARTIWRGAAATTAVSRHVATLAASAFGTAPRVILNGIPPVDAPTLRPAPEPVILWAGRMSVQKNPVLAVRALALLREIPWRACFLGDGPLAEETRTAARAAGLAGRVEFAGWQDENRVREAMLSAQILLMSSRSEGLPMVAVEALWHGLAVVATRVPGTEEVVEDGINGQMAEPLPEALAQALRPLLEDPSLLMRRRAASLEIAQRFDFRKTLDAYEEILRHAARP
ncbi:MAG: glycosyltransferase family 4 protein [Terrimicrobiaceae bacterium]|nr:glycosyltransferase family 4 protein [Terrimicrobiaceae bacterium]